MARQRINAAAALINGFSQGYQLTGRVLRDVDIAKVAKEAPVTTETLQEDAAGNITPTPKTTFLGKDYAVAPDEATMGRARQLAMAGIMEKYGDVEAGQSMRERIAAQGLAEERAARERELYPLQRKQAELGVSNAERQGRMGDREEQNALSMDALNADVGKWMTGRLTGPDGTTRTATPDDHLAAAQYRVGKLYESGKVADATKAQSEYHAAASAKIALDTAQRNEAIGKTVAALGAGDVGAVKDFYNQFVPDGAKVTDVKRGANGEITIQRLSDDGKPLPPTVLKDVNQVAAVLSTFKDPMALYQWSQGEFNRNMALRQDARAGAQLGLSQAAARRAEEDHAAMAPERQARGEAGKLRIELANLDDSTPAGAKRSAEIQAKLQALATGTRGSGGAAGGHDPADVAKARVLVSSGTYPDLPTALDAVINKPDQMHKAFVDRGLQNMAKPADAVKAADETMAAMGWNRNGTRWSKTSQNLPGGSVPQGAIDMLKSDPSLSGAFDAKYGNGAAARVLQGGPMTFGSAAEVERAAAEGKVKKGDRVIVDGRTATWQPLVEPRSPAGAGAQMAAQGIGRVGQAAAAGQGDPRDAPESLALDAARSARRQAERQVQAYGSRQRAADPEGFSAARAALQQAVSAEEQASQAYERSVARSANGETAFGRYPTP